MEPVSSMSRTPSNTPGPVPASPPAGSAKLVIVAAVLALVAIVLVNVYVEYIKYTIDEQPIVRYRLLQTLRPGERLRDRDIEAVQLPARYQDAFRNYISDRERDSKIGSIVLREATQGEFLSSLVFEQPEGSRLDDQIRPGFRLYALPVNSRTTIGGLRPGMHVDIEAPFRGTGTTDLILPVMEGVKVIEVGNMSTADEQRGGASRVSSFQKIGIEVTPQAASALSMIERIARGPFELHLRNPQDQLPVKILHPDRDTNINPVVLDMLPSTPPSASR
jgi:Flp pilus assembly protein CpaB